MDKKNIIITLLIAAVLGFCSIIVNIKKACDLKVYAIENDCTWTYQGTAYGDDRDYVCK